MQSPLRYPGGKAKLFKPFIEIIAENGLYNSVYHEPYAGGAGLAIKLLSYGYVSSLRLNDIDPAIYSLWSSILFETDAFCRKVHDAAVTVEEWKRQREIYKCGATVDALDLGFSAFFLNRTSRSGIIEGSGPIGGYDQRSEWKVDARFNKRVLVENIYSIAQLAASITVTNEDALDFISSRMNDEGAFFYLDPPYYVKGRKLYKNFYRHDDHAAIAHYLLKNQDRMWVVSYDNVPHIRDLYSSCDGLVYSLQYSAGNRSSGEEVIFASDAVRLPKFQALIAA